MDRKVLLTTSRSFPVDSFLKRGQEALPFPRLPPAQATLHRQEASISERYPTPALAHNLACFIPVPITLDFQALPCLLGPGLNAKGKAVIHKASMQEFTT